MIEYPLRESSPFQSGSVLGEYSGLMRKTAGNQIVKMNIQVKWGNGTFAADPLRSMVPVHNRLNGEERRPVRLLRDERKMSFFRSGYVRRFRFSNCFRRLE